MQVLVTGADGFLGGHTVRALQSAGHEVVGLSRRVSPEDRAVPGVTYVTGDITDAASLPREAFAGSEAIVHLVGIIREVPARGQTFERVHVDGTRNVLAWARQTGLDRAGLAEHAGRFVYVSAIGADPDAKSEYARTKAEAEQLVRDSGLPFTIFRPSIIVGPGAAFLAQMEQLIRKPPLAPFSPPFIPVPGSGRNRFQPVWVGDLTRCIARCLELPETSAQTYEVGGETVVTFDQLIEAIERRVGVKKPLLHAPFPLMFAAASVFEAVLPAPPLTTDQLLNLQRDNVCDNTAVRDAFGIVPLPFERSLDRVYSGRE